MRFFSLLPSLAVLVVGIATFPTFSLPRVQSAVHKRTNEVARSPVPIPYLQKLDATSFFLFKREEKNYTFGGYTAQIGDKETAMTAPFDTDKGSTWCNEIPSWGKDKDVKNWIKKAHLDSRKSSGGDSKPAEYVCFFYTSTKDCDPGNNQHAEYLESLKDAKNHDFDVSKYKYMHWGCQWHPNNTDCSNKEINGHPPDKKCDSK